MRPTVVWLATACALSGVCVFSCVFIPRRGSFVPFDVVEVCAATGKQCREYLLAEDFYFDRRMQLNIRNAAGNTPLHEAALVFPEVLRYMLRHYEVPHRRFMCGV